MALIPPDHGPSGLTYSFSFSLGDIFLDVEFAIDSTEITGRCSLFFFQGFMQCDNNKKRLLQNL